MDIILKPALYRAKDTSCALSSGTSRKTAMKRSCGKGCLVASIRETCRRRPASLRLAKTTRAPGPCKKHLTTCARTPTYSKTSLGRHNIPQTTQRAKRAREGERGENTAVGKVWAKKKKKRDCRSPFLFFICTLDFSTHGAAHRRTHSWFFFSGVEERDRVAPLSQREE